jgi:hypothetical protein
MMRAVRFGVLVMTGFLLLGEGSGLELELSAGAGWLAGDNVSESKIGPAAALSVSHTLVDGVDYLLNLQYAQVATGTDSTYVYRSIGMGVRWYPTPGALTPYCVGHIDLFDWRIGRDGKTAVNPSTDEEMEALSLALGAGAGCMWRLSRRIAADFLFLSHFIFSQNPDKFGLDDGNELLLRVQIGLSYSLF